MESDYTLLYLHHGLTSDNKPSLSWLRDAYREFDRKWVGACAWAPGRGPGGPVAWGAGGSGASSSAGFWAAFCLGRSLFHGGRRQVPLPG